MIKISHSGRGKYDHCPMMYRLHYVDKIRPAGTTSALLFGSAIDKACELYIKERHGFRERETFKQAWKEQEINGTLTELQCCTEIEYSSADFDADVLIESDNEYIIKDTIYKSVSDLVKAGQDKERIAYANWISLYRKGNMLVKAFCNWVDENVEEVLGTQVPIELEDGDGNQVTGFADFVIKVYGYDKPILVDLKTTARYYQKGSVKESEQLALYYFYLKQTKFPDMERAAFLVLSKNIKKNKVKTCKSCGAVTNSTHKTCNATVNGKRCNGEFDVVMNPEATVQYIHDEIDQTFIDETIDKFNVTVVNIEAGNFEKNLEGCNAYYGRECPYKKYCQSGCMDGLIKKEEKNEQEQKAE